jgi:hypothetical protein
MLELDLAHSDNNAFYLQGLSGAANWKVQPNAGRTILTDVGENSIIYSIVGLKF